MEGPRSMVAFHSMEGGLQFPLLAVELAKFRSLLAAPTFLTIRTGTSCSFLDEILLLSLTMSVDRLEGQKTFTSAFENRNRRYLDYLNGCTSWMLLQIFHPI